MTQQRMQIGEVSHLTGLSLRTIRYYGEVGLVVPSARSAGGFRLYTESDIVRLRLIKRMKPLEFSLDEMRDLLGVLDGLERPELSAEARGQYLARLKMFHDVATARVEAVRSHLTIAEGFAAELKAELTQRQQGS